MTRAPSLGQELLDLSWALQNQHGVGFAAWLLWEGNKLTLEQAVEYALEENEG